MIQEKIELTNVCGGWENVGDLKLIASGTEEQASVRMNENKGVCCIRH